MKNCRTTFQSLLSPASPAGPAPSTCVSFVVSVIVSSGRPHAAVHRLLDVDVEVSVVRVLPEAAVQSTAAVAQRRVSQREIKDQIDDRRRQEAQSPGGDAQERRHDEHPQPGLLVEILLDVEPIQAAAKTSRQEPRRLRDRKSTRLNSSHGYISYAVFCLKKKKKQ